ncbi:MAG: hypothetical protein K6F88_08370 [Ruminococcus sp.]|nr:hypothetical protein [Ruminococcus sp.]
MLKIPNFKKLVKDSRLKNIIIIIGALGVLLILISSFSGLNTEREDSPDYSVSQYKTELQDSLSEMLTRIEGVGNVSVLLTIENSVEGVYLENNSTKTKEIEPVIRGVIVACSGGDDSVVSARVLDAVTKALNISSAKVSVTKLQE